jgi:hypothetical protein
VYLNIVLIVNLIKSLLMHISYLRANISITFLRFVVPCIFKHWNKNTQPDATINCKIYCLVAQTLLNMFQALLCPSSGDLSNCSRSLRFSYECRGRCVSSLVQTYQGWKHIHLGIHVETGGCDCSLKELLMMGIIMPETCWAASMRLSNKFYNWLLHLFGCFYLNIWRCTELQTLNP